MIQLIFPNLDVKTNAGWCLWLVQESFGVPHFYRSAWEAWQATAFKHADRNLPNASVPVWFEHWGAYGVPPKYDNWGHVVDWVPGKGFLSSPGIGFGSEWLPTIAAVEARFRCKFVGWSEDISGIRVIKEGGNMPEKVTLDAARILASQCLARDGFDGRPNAHKGESDEDLIKHHVGKDLTNQYVRDNFFGSTEASNAFGVKEAVYRERDQLREAMKAANAKVKELESKLKAMPEDTSEAEKTLTEFAKILDKIQARK